MLPTARESRGSQAGPRQAMAAVGYRTSHKHPWLFPPFSFSQQTYYLPASSLRHVLSFPSQPYRRPPFVCAFSVASEKKLQILHRLARVAQLPAANDAHKIGH